MTVERVGLAVFGLVAVAMFAWNLSLRAELSSLQETVAERRAEPVVVAAGASATRPVASKRVRPEHREPAAPRGTARQAPRQGSEEVRPGGDEAVDEDQRREDRVRDMDWERVRSDMETKTVDLVESFGATHQWSPETSDEVLAILLESSDEIAALWGRANEEGASRYTTHREMQEIRHAADDDIAALVGAEQQVALAEEIWAARRDLFRGPGG